ncbi:MAG: hypothetical protein RI967_1722 [Planctomycetota bacterium]
MPNHRFIAALAFAACASPALAGGTAEVVLRAVGSYQPGQTVDVAIDFADIAAPVVGGQFHFSYDATQLEYVGVLAGDGPFTNVIYQSDAAVDASTRRVVGAVGVDAETPGAGIAAGRLAIVRFTAKSDAALCRSTDALNFILSGPPILLTDGEGNSLAFTAVDDVDLTLDGVAPVLSAVPAADIVLATDAGSTVGAVVADPTVTANDNCNGALTVTISTTGATIGSAWPVDGVFAIGTTTVVWSATDASGNSTSETRTITVEDHQLLDATLALDGAFAGSSTRSVRIGAGASTQIVEVAFTGPNGTASGVEVPVAASYDCLVAKSRDHSISATAAASVSGTRYSASFALAQGDSNDDNVVDVLDFGLFVGDIGGPVATNAISNFNADPVVNNADFSFISLNFFEAGATCGAANGATPRHRVSVKELRRSGLGHLAVADLNRDGWVDLRDMAFYSENGTNPAVRPGGDAPIE